jgi:glycosyltransferase involved in cell wall biosynthesis
MRYVARNKSINIGFVSTRLAGTDGVSLEAAKWAGALEIDGHHCFYMAGELDRPAEQSLLVKEAHFKHPLIQAISQACFDTITRKSSISQKIHQVKDLLKDCLYQFIRGFKLDLLIVENALTIPENLPLGMALTEIIAETGIPTICHHHDFFWERKRFLFNAVPDYLAMAFPPNLPSIQHVVINSAADSNLSFRTGISATIIPNVMDFENPPSVDEYSSDIRRSLGLEEGELLMLQPTRVVKRKRIEHSIELVRRLNQEGIRAKLVISHASGDEGYEYEQRLYEYSSLMGVDTLFVSDIIKSHRGRTLDGRKIYTPEDVYHHADLVTYPSTIEGFGNAFLEAVYFRRPIVVNNYSVYATDIKPKGFKVIELDDYVDSRAVKLTKKILDSPRLAKEMVDYNYELGKRYYSYSFLRRKLRALVSDFFGL